MRKMITGLVLASMATTPASAQTVLDKLLNKMMKPKVAAVTAPAPAAGVATMSPAQVAALDRLLATPLQDARLSAARSEAATLIRGVLAIAVCAPCP